MKICIENQTEEFVAFCEKEGFKWAKEGVSIPQIRGFVNRLKAGSFKEKSQAKVSLAYICGRFSQLRPSFLPTVNSILENYSLEDAWTALETILSYHAFYGGEQ